MFPQRVTFVKRDPRGILGSSSSGRATGRADKSKRLLETVDVLDGQKIDIQTNKRTSGNSFAS